MKLGILCQQKQPACVQAEYSWRHLRQTRKCTKTVIQYHIFSNDNNEFTYFTFLSCKSGGTLTKIFLVCVPHKTFAIVKARVSAAKILMRKTKFRDKFLNFLIILSKRRVKCFLFFLSGCRISDDSFRNTRSLFVFFFCIFRVDHPP